MNKIFKVIYSKVRGTFVVVSEFAKNHVKTSSTGNPLARKVMASILLMNAFSGLYVNSVHAADIYNTVESIQYGNLSAYYGTDTVRFAGPSGKTETIATSSDIDWNQNSMVRTNIGTFYYAATDHKVANMEFKAGTFYTFREDQNEYGQVEAVRNFSPITNSSELISALNSGTGGIKGIKTNPDGSITVETDLEVEGNHTVKGNTSLGDSDDDVTTITGSANVNGNQKISGDLEVEGKTTLGANTDATDPKTSEDARLVVNGNTYVTGDVIIDGKLIVNSDEDETDVNIGTENQGDTTIQEGSKNEGETDVNIGTENQGDTTIQEGSKNEGETDVNIGTENQGDTTIQEGSKNEGETDVNIGTENQGDTTIQEGSKNEGETDVNIGTENQGDTTIQEGSKNEGETDVNIGTENQGDTTIQEGSKNEGETDVNIGTENTGDTTIQEGSKNEGATDIQLGTGNQGETKVEIGSSNEEKTDFALGSNNSADVNGSIASGNAGDTVLDMASRNEGKTDTNIGSNNKGDTNVNIGSSNADGITKVNIGTDNAGDTTITIGKADKTGATNTQTNILGSDVNVTGSNSVNISAPKVNVTGDTKIDGTLEVTHDLKVDGSLIANDIVTGGQSMNQRFQKMEKTIGKVGANAAAIAALNPAGFEEGEKFSFALGTGNYRGENAVAAGLFYRPNSHVQMNMGTSFGTGENMVNMGVSFALDKAGFKGMNAPSSAKIAQKVVSEEIERVKAANQLLISEISEMKENMSKMKEEVQKVSKENQELKNQITRPANRCR